MSSCTPCFRASAHRTSTGASRGGGAGRRGVLTRRRRQSLALVRSHRLVRRPPLCRVARPSTTADAAVCRWACPDRSRACWRATSRRCRRVLMRTSVATRAPHALTAGTSTWTSCPRTCTPTSTSCTSQTWRAAARRDALLSSLASRSLPGRQLRALQQAGQHQALAGARQRDCQIRVFHRRRRARAPAASLRALTRACATQT